MRRLFTSTSLLVATTLFQATGVLGHVAAWHKGMYCLNGTTGVDNENTNDAVNPLFQLSKKDWWLHHDNLCDQFPPAPGDFLELPANGNFTVEHAMNRAFTSLSYDGKFAGTFTNGKDVPSVGLSAGIGIGRHDPSSACITDPNIHTQNETMASGTAFAISYQSDITQVTPENLVVFSVLYHSPWKRIATYQVPNLPACPDKGCICAWGWVPNGCGEPNMYMLPYRCKVTGTPGNLSIGLGVPPIWCEDDEANCTPGPKQMIFWNQAEGNNIEVKGQDLSGAPRSPAYNKKLGFQNGAQTDIFVNPRPAITIPPTVTPPASTLISSRFFLPTSVSPPGIPHGPRSTVSVTSSSRLSFIASPNWIWVSVTASFILCLV